MSKWIGRVTSQIAKQDRLQNKKKRKKGLSRVLPNPQFKDAKGCIALG